MSDLQAKINECQAPLCQRTITDKSPSRDFCSDTCQNAWWHDQHKQRPITLICGGPTVEELVEPVPQTAVTELDPPRDFGEHWHQDTAALKANMRAAPNMIKPSDDVEKREAPQVNLAWPPPRDTEPDTEVQPGWLWRALRRIGLVQP